MHRVTTAEHAPATLFPEEAADVLGVSRARVYQLMRDGQLVAVGHAERSNMQSPLFSRGAVERLKLERARGGRKASLRGSDRASLELRAFALFARGADLATCVRGLGVGAVKVRAFHEQWRTPLGGKPAKTLEDLQHEVDLENDAAAKDMDAKLAAQRKDADDRHQRAMDRMREPMKRRSRSHKKER